ncbi:hypothetical protein [Bradyrhizobium sp. CER78]|uniref:hypothetical protein n=1 Tax=Bradyrhizobium sp. CER78 TaxID=3039162 RepID=UPI00244D33C2|nr:hypothetical protein [Bradyrhizobium sp. CER78]MDH2380860.1 hypothetical protein [Bradyrhizobium sp. CER78]
MNDLAPIAALNVKRPINGRVLHGDTINGSSSVPVALNNGGIVSARTGASSCN